MGYTDTDPNCVKNYDCENACQLRMAGNCCVADSFILVKPQVQFGGGHRWLLMSH